jgi:DNA-binding transcriptional ArsR family regulator
MIERPVDLELKAKLYRGFADPTRLHILESLRGGEMTVGSIAEATKQSQSNVSNHLSCLKECGLVLARREGKSIFYSIASERVLCLLNDGDVVLEEVKDGVRNCSRYNRIE